MQHGKQEGTGAIPHCQPETGASNSPESPRVWPPSTAFLHTRSSTASAGLCKTSLPMCQLLNVLWGCACVEEPCFFPKKPCWVLIQQGVGPADAWYSDFKR